MVANVFSILRASFDDGFSDWLQKEIDQAGLVVLETHSKWPITSGSVSIPPGIHHVHKPIKLRKGVQIWGASQGSTVIISHLRGDDSVFRSDPDEEPYGMKIGHLHATSCNQMEGRFLDVYNANRNCVFHDLFIENFASGIRSQDCFTTGFRDVGIYRCRSGFSAANLTNGRIDNMKIENCSQHGFELTASSRNTTTGTDIRGLVCQGNGFSGVRLNGLDQIRFSSLFLEGNNRRAMREDGSEERFGQLSAVANTDLVNKRNGNLVFDSIFITPGHSELVSSPAVDIEHAENVRFNGGYIRSNRAAFRPAFRLGKGVNVCSMESITFQGFQESEITDLTPSTKLTTRDLVLVKPGSSLGVRIPEMNQNG